MTSSEGAKTSQENTDGDAAFAAALAAGGSGGGGGYGGGGYGGYRYGRTTGGVDRQSSEEDPQLAAILAESEAMYVNLHRLSKDSDGLGNRTRTRTD